MAKISRLREWRLHHGYSQKKVARLLRLKAQASVGAYEAGVSCPEPEIIRRIRLMTAKLGPFIVTVEDLQSAWESAHRRHDPEFDAGITAERKLKANGKEAHRAEGQKA